MIWNNEVYEGKHAIFEGIKSIPQFTYQISNYDIQHIPIMPNMLMLVVCGIAVVSAGTSSRFHSTFTIQIKSDKRSALIKSHAFYSM